MAGALKKIVIIGPESTGKSDLSQALAAHFNTYYAPEYAREYLLTNGSAYTKNDLLKIAMGQIRAEEDIVSRCARENKNVVFIDTDLQVIKTWSEFVFNCCDLKILNEISKRKYDFFLLTNTDLAWVQDELREYPDLDSRLKLYHHYRDALIQQEIPWAEISGMNESRLQRSIDAVNNFLNRS